MMDPVKLTVVIPTYNEAENLPDLVKALFGLPFSNLNILVVDDNSPDGTGDLAEELAAAHAPRLEVIRRPGKMGLGTAYVTGFRHALSAGATAIAQMDADFSHPPEKLVEMAYALDDCDVALGSRYVTGGSLDECWPRWRKALSAFGNRYARTILGLPVRDATGGYRLWRRETLLGIPFESAFSNGYAFQVELAYLATCLGFRFKEIPIHFADRLCGHSKMSFQIQREAAIRVWQMRWRYRRLAALAQPHPPSPTTT